MFLLYFFKLISFFYLSRIVTEKPHQGSVNKLLFLYLYCICNRYEGTVAIGSVGAVLKKYRKRD